MPKAVDKRLYNLIPNYNNLLTELELDKNLFNKLQRQL